MEPGYVEAKLEQLERDVASIPSQLSALEKRVDVRLEKLEKRMENLEQPLKEVNLTFRVLQRVILFAIAFVAAAKTGTLDPLRALIGGR